MHLCRTHPMEDPMVAGNRKKTYLILIVILVALLALLYI